MPTYITTDQARLHLRLGVAVSPDDPYADDLAMKVEQAETIVAMHLKHEPSNAGDLAVVEAACLKVLAHLWRFRGDDAPDSSPITPETALLLSMLRDPALA